MRVFTPSLPLIVFATFLAGSHGQVQNLRRRRTQQQSLLVAYGQIESGDSHAKACIELPPTAYNKVEKGLILGDCNSNRNGWRFDAQGGIHSQWNDEYCIQAHAHEGAHLRLVPCDKDDPQQSFVYHNDGHAIRPSLEPKLCVTWQGNHADVGSDPLLLKKCEHVEYQRHWIGNFPRSNDQQAVDSTIHGSS